MLLEMMDYATKLFNNMSETMSATTTATALPTISTSLNYSGLTPTPPTFAKMDTLLNSTVKSIINNTLVKVVKTNIADYTAQYTLPTGAMPSANAANDYSASSMQSPRQTQSSTFPTLIAGNKNRAPGIIIYPTVSPESIVIPIVSCIFGFPILALIVICCLRRRAKLARERDRRRNYDMQDHAVSLVRFSPIHRLSVLLRLRLRKRHGNDYRSSRAISLRPERSLSQGFTSLELDTVLEERSDAEQTQTEILNAESPLESTSLKMSFSS